MIELAGGRPVTVPVDENGMICDNLEALIETHRPKFIYVNSSYHDPTGNILSVERRRKLLELSTVIDCQLSRKTLLQNCLLKKSFLPTIKSMDRSENVIYIYSFALTFIPGMSMAFCSGPGEVD